MITVKKIKRRRGDNASVPCPHPGVHTGRGRGLGSWVPYLTLSLGIAGDSSEAECAHGGTGVGPGPQARLCLEHVAVSLATRVPVLLWHSRHLYEMFFLLT